MVCGKPRFADDQKDTLINPTLIIEVLSPSTEAYDRGEKFRDYQQIESLQEYVLVSQDRPCIERFVRAEENNWAYSATQGLDEVVCLESVPAELSLADVYAGVDFETESPAASSLDTGNGEGASAQQ